MPLFAVQNAHLSWTNVPIMTLFYDGDGGNIDNENKYDKI